MFLILKKKNIFYFYFIYNFFSAFIVVAVVVVTCPLLAYCCCFCRYPPPLSNPLPTPCQLLGFRILAQTFRLSNFGHKNALTQHVPHSAFSIQSLVFSEGRRLAPLPHPPPPLATSLLPLFFNQTPDASSRKYSASLTFRFVLKKNIFNEKLRVFLK